MALTPQVRSSQDGTNTVAESDVLLEVSQAALLAIGIFPTEFVQSSQDGVQVPIDFHVDLDVAQAGTMVVARGRVSDPYLRAWTFWMDNHWYYVLRLPTPSPSGTTLIYDTFAEQWYIWGSDVVESWRLAHGTNWLGSGALMGVYGSNAVGVDDGNGSLYFLNPDSPTDDDAIVGPETQRTFLREITGQVSVRGDNYVRCYGVDLMGSIGDNEMDLTDVTLLTSDDAGHTYDDQGVRVINALDYETRVQWNTGLGSFTAPGRLFKITDEGVLQRIDWLEMAPDPDGDKNG
jgi:hypothetical protein